MQKEIEVMVNLFAQLTHTMQEDVIGALLQYLAEDVTFEFEPKNKVILRRLLQQ